MDSKFHPAMDAIRSGDLDAFTALLRADPTLATAQSTVSHPTLLQCVVLDAVAAPAGAAMAKALIERGADIDRPLIAAAGKDNSQLMELLLDAGAAIDGDARWSPLEEALYWGSAHSIRVLLSRGAAIRNLRVAAGLGRRDLVEGFFDAGGTLTANAGSVASPFPHLDGGSRGTEPQAIIENAFVYACMHGHVDVAAYLLEQGGAIDAIPMGFDYAGTGLHYAAFRGHRAMVEFLLKQGADPTIKDAKVSSTPAGWADHSGHRELKELLAGAEARWAAR